MITVGIDLGASRLRIATDQGGQPAIVRHKFSDERLAWMNDGQPGLRPARSAYWQIVSLKRMLDFDRSIPLSTGNTNSLDYLAKILRLAVEDCRILPNEEDIRFVFAAPSCFSQRQRSSLKTAGTRAGFRRIKLVDDSLAALMASRNTLDGASTVLVYALGAGSFSCSLHRLVQGTYGILSQEGDRDLGGDAIDSALLNYYCTDLLRDGRGRSCLSDATVRASIVNQCEMLKLAMSKGESSSFGWEKVFGTARFPGKLPSSVVPRHIYDESVRSLVNSTLTLLDKILAQANGLVPGAVLLLGESTRLPEVKDAIKLRFGSCPLHHVDEGDVACGAILYGNMLKPDEWQSVEMKGDEPRCPGNSPLPPPRPVDDSPSPLLALQSPPQSEWAGLFVPLLVKAEQSERAGRMEECLQTFEELLDKLNDFGGGLYRKVASAWQAVGKRDNALKLLSEAYRRNPRNRLVAMDFAKACYTQATEFRKRRNHENGVRIISYAIEAIRGLPNATSDYRTFVAQLTHLHACLLAEQGLPAEAEKLLMQCVTLDPSVKAYQEDLQTIQQPAKSTGLRSRFKSWTTSQKRPGQNDPCSCGSGKKFKKCCGK
jgi:tetratricopeptide (TPR) repeat protein